MSVARRHIVEWKIDIWAENPVEAARQTLAIQWDPGSIATVFAVISPDGVTHEVDL